MHNSETELNLIFLVCQADISDKKTQYLRYLKDSLIRHPKETLYKFVTFQFWMGI